MKNFNVTDVLAVLATAKKPVMIKDINRVNGRTKGVFRDSTDVSAGYGDRTIEAVSWSTYFGKNANGAYERVVAHQPNDAVMRVIYLNDSGQLEVGDEVAHHMYRLSTKELAHQGVLELTYTEFETVKPLLTLERHASVRRG